MQCYFVHSCLGISLRLLSVTVIAERLSARQLIVQCGQLAFVCVYICIYIYMYIYPSHFNCVGEVSVVSSPDY